MEKANRADIKMHSTIGMHKSAIIYRDDSASYLYVCFHCSQMYNNIKDTLQHIESHFQMANVVLDQFIEDEKEEKFTDCSEIKCEIIENNEFDNSSVLTIFEQVNDNDREQIEAVDLKESLNRSEPSTNVKKARKKPASTRPYKCHKCPQTCRFVNELSKHLKTHINDDMLQLYRCKECDCYYKNGFELRFHVLGVHLMQKKFYCNACSAEFIVPQNKEFEEHLNQHNAGDEKLWTNIVDGIYLQSNRFTKFEEINSFTEQEYSCEFCTHRFYIKCNLDMHLKIAHSRRIRQIPLQCSQCDCVFTTPKYYYAHQLEHQRVGPIVVERDDNILLDNLDACVDERIIYDEDEFKKRSFRCLICNTSYELHHDIRSHIRDRHVYKMFPPPIEPKKEFICDLCGLRLKTKAALKNHFLIHTNTKSHPCKICGKKFRQKSDRTIHERQHSGEKPFQCHQCGRGFISKGLLTAHQISHDDSTYPCPTCGKVFNLPSGYRRHIQTHRQDRAFKCTICSKSFNTRLYLTKHMSTHSDKQYKCRFCELKFNTGDGRRQHQRYKHRYATS